MSGLTAGRLVRRSCCQAAMMGAQMEGSRQPAQQITLSLLTWDVGYEQRHTCRQAVAASSGIRVQALGGGGGGGGGNHLPYTQAATGTAARLCCATARKAAAAQWPTRRKTPRRAAPGAPS